MDEEQRVSEQLERIEALQRGRAPEGALLAELRGLLEAGEAFLAAEAAGAHGAASAPERCAIAVAEGKEVAPRT